jgi:hypothetical protein
MTKADSFHKSGASKSASKSRKSQSQTPAHSFRTSAVALGLCAIFLLGFYTLALSAVSGKSPTADEPLHLVGARIQYHQADFRCNPEDPPLWKYWAVAGTSHEDLKISRRLPLWNEMLPEITAQITFVPIALYATGGDVNSVVANARARMAILGILLGILIAAIAWKLAGPIAAVVATAAFCVDPNFLAHAPLIKNDVAITLVLLAFSALLWRIGEKVTLPRWITLTLLIAIALTTKFSGILAFPVLAVALLLRAAMKEPWPFLKWTASTRLKRLAVAAAIGFSSLIVSFIFIWAVYDFRFGPSPDPNQLFDSKSLLDGVGRNESVLEHGNPPNVTDQQLDQWVRDRHPSLVDRLYQWSDEKHLLPQAFIRGFYYTWGRGLLRATYLCGDLSVKGWSYYFPAAMLFKTPLATLGALAAAVIAWLLEFHSKAGGRDRWKWIAFLSLPVLYTAAVMSSNLNLGLRHIFPIYPFLFIFIGVVAARAWRRKPAATTALASVFLLGVIAETAFAYPDYIPFFNIAAGGSRGGLYLLGDSNLDWGQDLPDLSQWQKHHPDKQLYLCYFGGADPRYYGVRYINALGSFAPPNQKSPLNLPPVLAISATNLQGIYESPEIRNFFAPLLKQKPIAVLGGSIYLYDQIDNLLPNLPLERPAP